MTALAHPRVLIPESKIRQRILELANEISYDYRGKEITAICVLKGSYIFFADLIRGLARPLNCEFMGVSSYGTKTVSSGEVKITLDMTEPANGKHIIIVEDIVDTGLTMQYLLNHLKARKPASIKVCTLLLKPESMKCDVQLDYVGFRIANEFVVGYGLDYAGSYRQIPYIGVLDNET
ncbi:MAG: hypoxanthine phosphoribosyltransferase [Deltaproteobacteria bacterium]|nr:hypoxanthine phosphoribosyltransferase [Deltaproteobacteria bacterium]